MTDRAPKSESKSQAFIRGAGNVDESNPIMKFPPARWIVQLIQYMIAIIIITIGEGFKAIISGESPRKKKQRQQAQRTE